MKRRHYIVYNGVAYRVSVFAHADFLANRVSLH